MRIDLGSASPVSEFQPVKRGGVCGRDRHLEGSVVGHDWIEGIRPGSTRTNGRTGLKLKVLEYIVWPGEDNGFADESYGNSRLREQAIDIQSVGKSCHIDLAISHCGRDELREVAEGIAPGDHIGVP